MLRYNFIVIDSKNPYVMSKENIYESSVDYAYN